MREEVLTIEEREVLSEFINISFGLAASLIGDMLDSYAKLHIPSVHVIKLEDLEEYIPSKLNKVDEYYVTKQVFKGEFIGESVFIVDGNSIEKLSQKMYDIDVLDENHKIGIALETTNIITGACLGQLAELLQKEIYFQPPQITITNTNTFFEPNQKITYSNIIIIETILDIEDLNLVGYLFILTDQKSLQFLKDGLH